MIRKWHWYVGFFVLLFGAYFFYFSRQEEFFQSGLPVINNNVQAFSFTNQDGKNITGHDVEGKVYVTEYFFTTCKGICPKMNANMRRVYDAFKNNADFMIISHTCMPETDSVPLLKKYESKMLAGALRKNEDGTFKIDYDTVRDVKQAFTNNNWNFVTGDKTELYKLARQSYMIDNNKPDTGVNINNQFIHTQFFALVDKQTRVRNIYDGLKEDEIQKLLKDIEVLLKEKYQGRGLN